MSDYMTLQYTPDPSKMAVFEIVDDEPRIAVFKDDDEGQAKLDADNGNGIGSRRRRRKLRKTWGWIKHIPYREAYERDVFRAMWMKHNSTRLRTKCKDDGEDGQRTTQKMDKGRRRTWTIESQCRKWRLRFKMEETWKNNGGNKPIVVSLIMYDNRTFVSFHRCELTTQSAWVLIHIWFEWDWQCVE